MTMTDEEIRNAVLEFAYNKPKMDRGIEGEEGGRFPIDELSKLEGLEGVERNIIDLNIDYLVKEDSLKCPVMGLLVITHKGIDEYERYLGRKEKKRRIWSND